MGRFDAIAFCRACVLVGIAFAVIAFWASPVRAGSLPPETGAKSPSPEPSPTAAEFAALEEQLQLQRRALERLEGLVQTQSVLIENQQRRLDQLEAAGTAKASSTTSPNNANTAPTVSTPGVVTQSNQAPAATSDDDQDKRKAETSDDEKNLKRWGKIKINGQVRLRFDSEWNRGLDTPVDLNARNRLRFRVRLSLGENLDEHCDWGFRVTTGEPIGDGSANQTFTDFFSRKPFQIDRAFLHYTTDRSFEDDESRTMFEVTAGKQQIPWEVNSVNIDDQLQPEGIVETVRIKGNKKAAFQGVAFSAWQMVFDQRSNQPDAILYGVNVNPEFTLSENWNTKGWLQLFFLRDFAIADPGTSSLAKPAFTIGDTHPINGILEVDYNGWGDTEGGASRWLLALRGEWIYNADGPSHGKSAWDFDVQLGRLAKPGDWLFEGLYYRAGTDVFPLFLTTGTDLDSNAHGTQFAASYMVERNIRMRARYIGGRKTNTDSPINRWSNRFQFDVLYAF